MTASAPYWTAHWSWINSSSRQLVTVDVPLTLTQLLPLTGAVIVCTPQKVALDDARRAVRMFQQLSVKVLGIVENMTSFTGDDGKTYDLFGQGGAELLAQEMNLPFLGAIPIHPELRINADAGIPTRNWQGPSSLAETLAAMRRRFRPCGSRPRIA